MANLWPRITIVTPSFNQGKFLEQTIQSVLGQNYPTLDYIIMDGGSTDQSVSIIKKYESHLSYWQSKKDDGQSAAINEGFQRGRGEIMGWINSDDYYLPGTLHRIASILDSTKAQWLAGNGLTVDESRHRASMSHISERSQTAHLPFFDFIIQPSTFWTRSAWEKVGILDSSLHYAFDWDWFIRAEKEKVEQIFLDAPLSYYRVHDQHKTATGVDQRDKEIASIYEKYVGKNAEELFLKLSSQRAFVRSSQRWFKRLGFKNREAILFRMLYPQLCKNFTSQNLQNILEML